MLYSQWIGALSIARSFYQLYNYNGYESARTPALCLLQYVKEGLTANFLEQIPENTRIEDILLIFHNTFVVSRVAYQNDELPREFAVQMANQFEKYLNALSKLGSAEELMKSDWGQTVVRYLGYGYSNLGLWRLYEATEQGQVSNARALTLLQSIRATADTAAHCKATFAKYQNPSTTYQRQDVTLWLQTWTDMCIAHVDPSFELKPFNEYWSVIRSNIPNEDRVPTMKVLSEHLYKRTLTKENWKADSLVGMSPKPALIPDKNSGLNKAFVSVQNGFRDVLNQHWPKSRRIGFPLPLGDLLGIIGDDFEFPEEDLTYVGTWNAVDAAIHLNVDMQLVNDYIRSAENALNLIKESINVTLIELLQNEELSSRALTEVLFTIFPVPALVLRGDPRFNYVTNLTIGPKIQNQVNFVINQAKLDDADAPARNMGTQ